MDVHGKRIFVGLSGGVDSAVSAALLKEAGAHVTGVFIRGWYPPGLPCTWADDRRDAMRVAAKLHIPFLTLDARVAYKHGVIDYLLAEYRAGRTPNPDVMCNREVKFGAFYRFAKEEGADLIATGHYANGGYEHGGALLRGRDQAKDQSYFLWAVPKEVLAETVFPIGNLPKPQVRARATRYGLPNAQKKDSQGICFLGSISIEDFLRGEFGASPGRAVDTEGKEIGRHGGAVLYTLGERVTLSGAPPGPWFVAAKDVAKNELVVAKERVSQVSARGTLSFEQANWFREPSEAHEIQTRYHGPLVMADVGATEAILRESPPEPIAPGQSVVCYAGEVVVGGAIISRTSV